jgi:anaerobic magnesium-protoporphyrin IX monomethyl ester cyclase
VGISVKTFTAAVAAEILGRVRRVKPGVVTIVGGPHVTLDGPNYVVESAADYGMEGEGERSLPEFCGALDRKEPVSDIRGLLIRCGSDVRRAKPNSPIAELDTLSVPDFSVFSSVRKNGGTISQYPILTSRGCPYRCSYCSMPEIMGGKWRWRDPAAVVNELWEAKSRYQSDSFTVIDDNLTLNIKRVEQICDLLIAQKIGMSWDSQNGIRADRLSAALAAKMRVSGCRHVWIGIESADEGVFEAIDKGETLADICNGIRHLQRAGVRVGGFFIVGLPGSTREKDLKMIDFVRKNRIEAFVFTFVPYPKTAANDWVQKYGTILRSYEGAAQYGGDSIDPVFDTPEYPREDRVRTIDEINIRLGYFDRLATPAASQWRRWRQLYALVRPYGGRTLLDLATYALRYNARLFLKWASGLYA